MEAQFETLLANAAKLFDAAESLHLSHMETAMLLDWVAKKHWDEHAKEVKAQQAAPTPGAQTTKGERT